MSQAIKELRFDRFVDKPTSARFRKLQDQILVDPNYDPNSLELRLLGRHFDQNEFGSVLLHAIDMFPIWRLSPHFHFLVGLSALETGDLEWAEQKKASRACLSQLMQTGNGTHECPFRVTYRQDERDVLAAMEAEIRCQQLVETKYGFRDVVTLHDGADIWFDIDRIVRPGRTQVV